MRTCVCVRVCMNILEYSTVVCMSDIPVRQIVLCMVWVIVTLCHSTGVFVHVILSFKEKQGNRSLNSLEKATRA